MAPLIVKKYANRRLYDTEDSRYITNAELSARVRAGRDVRVLDAKTDEDLTQPTLVQLLVDGNRAHLLPVPLLLQLVRLGDDALAEFYGRYMTWALEVYFSVKQRASTSINPFAQMPFDVGGALARMFMGNAGGGNVNAWTAPSAPALTPPPEPPESNTELASLRRDLEQIKRSLDGRAKKKPQKRAR